MDNARPEPVEEADVNQESHRHSWSTPYSVAVGAGVLAVAAMLTALAGVVDNRGVLLLVVAVLVLLVLAAHVALLRPRLAADAETVTVRTWSGSHTWAWSSVRVDVRHNRRLGRRVSTLEIDGVDVDGVERLVILGRFDLGTDPEDIAAALARLRHESQC